MGEKRQKMVQFWTNEDICAILSQLDEQMLPFQKYQFSDLEEGLKLLGKGSSAYVYAAGKRGKKKQEYAIKVIGFGNQHADSKDFQNAVDMQKRIGSLYHVVKIYDTIELRVWLEGECKVVNAEVIHSFEEERPAGNYLHLQFLVMEKVSPILISGGNQTKLFPPRLSAYHESEIVKLAYEVGAAIENAHEKNLLHRDIKPENIFYSAKERHYKLGDFGIAKTMENGLVSTCAFTKGYGAPEVIGTVEDKYDQTADIYSFGMTLYVLLNEKCFPASKNYQPNISCQYQSGFVPPEPLHGSDELCRIVLKMISFHPEDRYQTMDEVLNDLDSLLHGNRAKYQREHKELYFVMATAFAGLGAILWKLSFAPDISFHFSAWMYLFAVLCVIKGTLKHWNKDTLLLSTGILGIGIYLLVSTGFLWWKLFLLLFLACCFNEVTGLVGMGLLFANFTYIYMEYAGLTEYSFSGFRWITVLLLSLSMIFLLFYSVLCMRKLETTRQYFTKNIFWIMITCYYLILIYLGHIAQLRIKPAMKIYEWIFGKSGLEFILSCNPKLIGICGAGFCLFWMVREYVLQRLDKMNKRR